MLGSQKQFKIGWTYFAVAALMGTSLRVFPFIDIPLAYKHVLHTHSHIALLGWVYMALIALLYKSYGPEKISFRYRLLLGITHLSLVGMLFSFPFQGYGLFSIFFSTLFLFVTYGFTYWLLRRRTLENSASSQIIKAALFYLVISSIGPWSLGPIMALQAQETIWYRLAVYFYLHFQYNGWMQFALIGLFLKYIESKSIEIEKRPIKKIIRLLHLSVWLGFFIDVLWTEPPIFVYLLAGIGGLLSLVVFVKLFRYLTEKCRGLSWFHSKFLTIIYGLILLKSSLQTFGAIPVVSNYISTHLDLVIAYLHLSFLGVISLSILWIARAIKIFSFKTLPTSLFIGGFFLTELLLVFRALWGSYSSPIWGSTEGHLALGSGCMLVSVLGMLLYKQGKE